MLEVIVASVEEARQAYAGGADRLEVVRDLAAGGLTPPTALVDQIAGAVPIPLRVMLRENPTMAVGDHAEVQRLAAAARAFNSLPVQGLVLGFVRDGAVDEQSMHQILQCAPNLKATFHRAFEQVRDPILALATLKRLEPVDRVLIRLSASGGGRAIADVERWQEAAAPQMRFVCGVGLSLQTLELLRHHPNLSEVHVGRLAREGHKVRGPVSSALVANLKSALA